MTEHHWNVMPLDLRRFRNSKLYTALDDTAFAAGLLLMCAAWRSVPAASLRDDDRLLSYYAGFGPAVGRWRRLRERALADWVLCSDGRLYHPDVAVVANEAWLADLLKAGRRALKRCAPVDGIAAEISATIALLASQQRSPVVARARAWLQRHGHHAPCEAEQRPIVLARQLAGGVRS